MTGGESWIRNMHTKQSLATSMCLFPLRVFRICNYIILLSHFGLLRKFIQSLEIKRDIEVSHSGGLAV